MGDLLADDLIVLDWVSRYTTSLGYPPTVREIQTAFGMASSKIAFRVLHRLEAFGFLDVDEGISRGLRLTGLPDPQARGVSQLKIWLAEGAQLVHRLADVEDKVAQAWLKRVSVVTF